MIFMLKVGEYILLMIALLSQPLDVSGLREDSDILSFILLDTLLFLKLLSGFVMS